MCRNNNKRVDLSLNIRLSGLTNGAKLELVQLSRSASVVSVALQLPESEARGVPNGRLMDKFPSTTTLWLVLRKFEAGVAGGGGVQRNLTARGTPATNQGDSGAGRLYYERPVLQIMGRELSSFTDLQKTLGQLGFNSGNTLLRLSFRTSDTPLEEAMAEIEEYFKSVEGDSGPAADLTPSQSLQSITPQISQDSNAIQQPTKSPVSPPPPSEPAPVEPTQQTIQETSQETPQENYQPSMPPPISPTDRPITVLAPSTSNTPQAAMYGFNDRDYHPTVEQMRKHQANLVASSVPQRLPSDAEIASREEEAKEKLASIKSIEVKIRFPDQQQVVSTFTSEDTGQTLYDFVRTKCLDRPAEAFQLKHFTHGPKGSLTIIPDSAKRLIQDLKLQGRVLVNFVWSENASFAARTAKFTVKQELRAIAQKIQVEVPESPSPAGEAQNTQIGSGQPEKKKSGGIPKWMKLHKK
jgi:tether containing UBX domain for GLUT4